MTFLEEPSNAPAKAGSGEHSTSEIQAGAGMTGGSGHGASAPDRKDVASSGTARDKPHKMPQDDGAANDRSSGSSGDAPAAPANASGVDKVPVAEQDEEIDKESMYDRRPERDKDQPPSDRH